MNCPICGIRMKPTANDNLFLCPERKRAYLPVYKETINYYDCALEIHAEGGYTFQQYEIPPYKVVIRNPKIYTSGADSGSHVMIVSTVAETITSMGDIETSVTWKEAFRTDEMLELPWHDLEKCIQKLKLLATFY